MLTLCLQALFSPVSGYDCVIREPGRVVMTV